MNIAVTADEVRTDFGLAGVVYFPWCMTPRHGPDARTEHLLGTVGLPDTKWFMPKASLRADDYIGVPCWYGKWGTAPDECRNWLVLGMLAGITLGLDPSSATVYALGDGPAHMAYSPLYRDVGSLVCVLAQFQNLQQALEEDDKNREERVDALRDQITAFAPLPFADEESQWHLAFEEVIDGIG
ncbi:SUKH-4 family immunity protein [Streptomyces sp. NPDC002262]|uniref:SUKH-4 family immunity protein n=1 Tax=Streptomyces sp. NPDC002262 TaxID=3154414 RepID=UPI00331D2736